MGERDEEGGESCSGVRDEEGGSVEVIVCCVGVQPTSDREVPAGSLAEDDLEGTERRP